MPISRLILAACAALIPCVAMASPPSPYIGQPTGDASLLTVLATNANTARTTAAQQADVINARNYGVTGNGTTDDTSAINTLMQSLPQYQHVIFPAGIYKITGNMTWDLNKDTVSAEGAVFLYSGSATNIDILDIIGGGSSATGYSTVTGLHVASSTVMAAGSVGIHVERGNFINFIDSDAYTWGGVNTLYTAVWVDEPDFVTWTNGNIQGQYDDLAVSSLGDGYISYDVYFNNIKYGRSSNACIHVGGGVDNVNFPSGVTNGCGVANVLIDDALEPYGNQKLNFGRSLTNDMSGGYGVLINNTHAADVLSYCDITYDGNINGAANDGVYLQSDPHCLVHINSPHILNSGGSGIHITDTSAALFLNTSTIDAANTGYGVTSDTVGRNVYGMVTFSGVPIVANAAGDLNNVSYIGEDIPLTLNGSSAVAMTSGLNPQNILTITLLPGTWKVCATLVTLPNTTTTTTSVIGAINNVSGAIGTSPSTKIWQMNSAVPAGAATSGYFCTVPYTFTVATPVYLVGEATFGVSTLGLYGSLDATRIY